jgi:hypothetical protein
LPNLYMLDLLQLTYAALAIFGAWGLGMLLSVSGTAERIFVGLGVVASISVPLLITSPGDIRWVASASILVGVLKSSTAIAGRIRRALIGGSRSITAANISAGTKYLVNRIWAPTSRQNIVTIFVSSILTAWLFPVFFTFESHDLIYFGWLPSLFTGHPLAVDFAVPMQMGITNSMPSLFLVSLANPFTSPIFLDFIALRAWLVLLFTFLILKRISNYPGVSGSSKLRLASALGLVLLIWGGEWAYTMLISSFIPAIGLALIALSLLSGSRNPPTIFLLFSLVAVSKAPIIAISLLTLVFLTSAKIWRPSLATFVYSLAIISGSVATWFLGPKGPSSNDTAFSVTGFSLNSSEPGLVISSRLFDWAASFTGLAGWMVDYPMSLLNSVIFSGSRTLLISATALSITWMLSKYFLTYFFVRRNLPKTISRNLAPLDIWAAGALFSILFVRNGESLTLGHQAHAFILLSVPLSILVAHYLLTHKTKIIPRKKNLGTLTLVTLLCLLGLVSTSSPMTYRASSTSAISLSQALYEHSEKNLDDGALPTDRTRYSRLQVIAAITNTKFAFSPHTDTPSQVDKFLVYSK